MSPAPDLRTAPSTAGRPTPDGRRFPFDFDGPVGVAARAVVIHPDRAFVDVGDDRLVARFGPWVVETPLSNVTGATLTGPYRWWKVAGPPHLSFSDRGLTFATNVRRGVCVEFGQPVPGIEPTGRIRHPGLTVTVADPERLVAVLLGTAGNPSGVEVDDEHG